MKRMTEQRLGEIEKANTWNFDWGNVAGGGSRDREKGELIREIRALQGELTEKDATIERLWETLQWTLSALTRMSASEPVFNLDEVISHATRVLQESEHDNE